MPTLWAKTNVFKTTLTVNTGLWLLFGQFLAFRSGLCVPRSCRFFQPAACVNLRNTEIEKEANCFYLTSFPERSPSMNIRFSLVRFLNMDVQNCIRVLEKGQLERAGLHGLKKLVMRQVELEVLEYGFLEGMLELTHLEISFNNIKSLDPNVFSGGKNLSVLILRGNPLTTIGKKLNFPELNNLFWLDMSNCLLEYVPKSLFKNLKNLQLLELQNNKLQSIDWRAFRTLGLTAANTQLRLENNVFECDCRLGMLLEYLQGLVKERQLIYYISVEVCTGNANLRRLNSTKIAIGAFMCSTSIHRLEYAKNKNNTSQMDLHCDYSGYPAPAVTWKKGNSEIGMASMNGNILTAKDEKYEFFNDTPQILSSLTPNERKYNIKYRATLTVQNFSALDSGKYSCLVTTEFTYSEQSIVVGTEEFNYFLWIALPLLILLLTASVCLLWLICNCKAKPVKCNQEDDIDFEYVRQDRPKRHAHPIHTSNFLPDPGEYPSVDTQQDINYNVNYTTYIST